MHTSSFTMSESDDSDILADIQALDEALALNTNKNSRRYVSSNQRSDNLLYIEERISEDKDDYSDYLYANRHIDESLNAYEINTRLITGLMIAKKKLIVLLEECEQKLKLLDEKMKSREESSLSCKLAVGSAGIPYFKDKHFFSAPKNYDTKLKEARGELCLLSLRKPSRWTRKDREILLNAIKYQAFESVLDGEISKEIDESASDHQAKKIKLLPRNDNEMVGALGEREFDWYKISVMDFDNRHSPGECRAMWNVYLHPDFKKSEWTNAEDKKLLKYAKEYKYQDWDAITQKVGTNRSGYQCFIRYNTIKKIPLAGRAWTRQEDKHLMKVMNAVKIGDYIPWSEVANHLRHRTKQQIYVRWNYRKNPHLRKGRFTYMETTTLLKAVQKYGKDFCKISSVVMPHRTSIQLQDRYHTVMANINNWNLWSLNDDMTLINLHLKYKNNWSKIATYFSDKTRTQVRHRYNALLKYTMKGVSIENIPRPPPSVYKERGLIYKKSLSNGAKKIRNKIALHEMQRIVSNFDIQLRLYETLCFPPSIKSNNSEEPCDIEQLVRDTKKLYNTLHLLNANLDIPDDFLNYVQLNNREKQLLFSLKEHINVRNNRIQNNELIEKFRIRMFGHASEVNESDFFIPPLPFDGYVKIKKIKNQKNTIDYDFDMSEKFLVDVPADFSMTPCLRPLVSIEEETQFHKLGQFLISDYRNDDRQNINLYKSLKYIFSFAKRSTSNETSSEYKLNVNSKSLEDYDQMELNKREFTIKEEDEETNINNIILPNQATLLGLKNLFLWKLLYDLQHESHLQCEIMASFGKESKSEQTATNSQSIQTESVEYQLLRTRLRQLFKFPISLSNTILQVHGPEAIFSKQKDKSLQYKIVAAISRKRKLARKNERDPVQLNEKDGSNVLADSNSLDSDVTTENRPRIRSCKIVRKKYKITTK